MQYTDKTFQDVHMSTIGLDYRLKTMTLKNGKIIKLQIWDTAGQDRFRAITKNYYKGANGIILIYDITSLQSYDNVKSWISQIREEASPNVVIYIAGNKIDLEEERKVKTEDGQIDYNYKCQQCLNKEYRLDKFGRCEMCYMSNCLKCEFTENNSKKECLQCERDYYLSSDKLV